MGLLETSSLLLEGNEAMSKPLLVGHYRLLDFILLVLFTISLCASFLPEIDKGWICPAQFVYIIVMKPG